VAAAIFRFCFAALAFASTPSSVNALTHALDSFERLARMQAWHPADPAVCIEQYA
jgi:hypothetical protein